MALVIVQGIPFRKRDRFHSLHVRRDDCRDEACSNVEKKILEELFALYCNGGSVKCLYLWSIEVKDLPESIYGANYDNFARMSFDSSDDVSRICRAAERREIAIHQEHRCYVLTVTPVSDLCAPVEKLNDDCLRRIFSMFPIYQQSTLEQVCTRWEKVAVPNVKILKLEDTYPEKEIEKFIIKYGPYIQRFQCIIRSLTIMSLITEHCKNIQTLESQICPRGGETLNHLSAMFAELKNLKSVSLITFENFYAVGQIFEQLPESMHTIHIRVNVMCRPAPLRPVNFTKFRNLKSLKLDGLFLRIEEGDLLGLEYMKDLVYLNVGGLYFFHPSYAKKIQNFRELRTLQINRCPIGDNCLIEILTNNSHLEDLNIQWITNLTDRSVQLTSTLPHLKRLDVSYLPKVTLRFMDPMPSLITLLCIRCEKVTNEGLARIIQSAPNLEFINMTKCSVTSELFVAASAALRARENNAKLRIFTNIDKNSVNWRLLSLRLIIKFD